MQSEEVQHSIGAVIQREKVTMNNLDMTNKDGRCKPRFAPGENFMWSRRVYVKTTLRRNIKTIRWTLRFKLAGQIIVYRASETNDRPPGSLLEDGAPDCRHKSGLDCSCDDR